MSFSAKTLEEICKSKIKEICIYVHWPFCVSKCPYCDFNSHIITKYSPQEWIQAYIKEIELFSKLIKNKKIKSIFFGGGTPSLMNPIIPKIIIDTIKQYGIVDKNTEISLEANPNSSEVERFFEFKKAGINRLSIGVQSLQEDVLAYLGRKHSKQEAVEAVKNAKKHFDNVSLDIIYACEKHTMKNWQQELEKILELNTNHISLYQLIIEKNTKFHQLFENNKIKIPDENLIYQLSVYTNRLLKEFNYHQYEISNYATNNTSCVHNLNYWEYKSYLGIGPGAHSRIINNNIVYSFEMRRAPNIWQNAAGSIQAISKCNILTEDEKFVEMLFMGLRIKEGIPITRLKKLLVKKWDNLIKNEKFTFMKKERLILLDDSHLKLSSKGLQIGRAHV